MAVTKLHNIYVIFYVGMYDRSHNIVHVHKFTRAFVFIKSVLLIATAIFDVQCWLYKNRDKDRNRISKLKILFS